MMGRKIAPIKWKVCWDGTEHPKEGTFSLPRVKLSVRLGGICCPTFPLWPYTEPRGNKKQAHSLVINITSDTISPSLSRCLSFSLADACHPISPHSTLATPDCILDAPSALQDLNRRSLKKTTYFFAHGCIISWF